MAMVLDAFAYYVRHLLTQVAADEVGMLLGVSGEIDKMGNKLQELKNFLSDADRRNITDESVQEWVGQLKRAMYEAADILDLCQLKAMERGSSSVHLDAQCFNPLLFCMRNPIHAHEIGTRIKALNQRLDIIKERSAAFSFVSLVSYEDHRSSMAHTSPRGNPNRETSGEFDHLGVVGDKIEENTRALVTQILQTREEIDNNIMVVAIVGVGGIGKTTLAQKVFNDEAIQVEFSKKIWLSVNQNLSHVELLRRSIVEARGGEHQKDMVGDSMVALHRTLKEALVGHKTLLVMDDVWDHGAWEGALKTHLVNDAASGSRVLITTRDEGVARGMRASWPYHHVDTLAPDDAWSLLKKQVLSSEIDEDYIDTLKDIGLKIIEKCGGLPLAVKVMGGLLRKRGDLRHDWEQVLGDSKWSITKMPRELNYAVYLSYEDMPPYLKQCFLFYSLLPKSVSFNMYQVVAMWMSEGFIHGNSSDLEEMGRSYYKELVSRNLIEPDKSYFDLWVCSMHDVVRSFAQYMTKDEAFVAHYAENDILMKLSSRKFLRLSIETDQLQSGELHWKSLQEQQSVRTLISTIQIKMKPGDSLAAFSSLRTLHIESADVAVLVESLHELKHLRYLTLVNADISVLPVNIGKMKLLQYLDLDGCKNIANLPGSIVKLGQLRSLRLANISMIPRGFSGLTNLRRLVGFRAHMDGDWCSLNELGPLSQLRHLVLNQLENVSAASFGSNAKLCEKVCLTDLYLLCTNRLGDDGLVQEKEGVSEEEQQRIEKVFDELCPPSSIENIYINGYFGQKLPSWIMSMSTVPLNNLKVLFFSDLACCTQLPTGLCRLPYLRLLQVYRAPCIKRVGIAFLQAVATPFPRLNKMKLIGMVEWEEWEWEKQVQAMPRLEKLWLINCKLGCIPPGLSSNAKALKVLHLSDVQKLSYLENFPYVVELIMVRSPDLERISNLPNLQKLNITNCPKLKVLESIPSLERLVLEDYTMETLPGYMSDINPHHLQLFCRLWLLASLAIGQSGTEWDKFSHVEHVKAYARDGENPRKWYLLYKRRDNFKIDSNISRSTVFEEILSSCMVGVRGFEHVYKLRRSTFSYVCNLVRLPFLEDMIARDHTFADGRVLSLQDRVAVALTVLSSGEPPKIVGSSIGVDESTASLVTQRFVKAMAELAFCHSNWPHTREMEKITRKFDMVHDLPNYCGVVNTIHIQFGCVHVLMQAVNDPDMRFTNIWLCTSSGSMNNLSILQDSDFFKDCENGTWLNGNKLKLSDGSEVAEYIIGHPGYPLRPWLITPYRVGNGISLSGSQVEFNRRHSKVRSTVLTALERFKGTWKCLQGKGWHPNNQLEMYQAISACCLLHNIIIDVEEDADKHCDREEISYINKVRQVTDEDAMRVRDALSLHLIKSRETLSSSMLEAQITTVGRRTFTYICSLVRNHTFFEGGVMSLQDQVAIALRMLSSGEPLVIVGSSLGVKDSTVLLVTQGFVEAMWERAMHHFRWPGPTKMDKIKRKFDKIDGLPNCCGVVHTTHIKSGSEDLDDEENDGMLMQVIVGPDMSFTNIWLGPSASMNHSSIFRDSRLFKECQVGTCLNGRKLNISAGGRSKVGEYIVGDPRYPLLPWLLTPYQLEDKALTVVIAPYQAEFNRRHSLASTITLAALARLKDTWKILDRKMWHSISSYPLSRVIYVCCMLHNIVIEMEEEQGTYKPNDQHESYSKQVRQLADEDAVSVRDALAQHLIKSRDVGQQIVSAASCSGDKSKVEQEALRQQKADRGKEKVHEG